MTNYLDYFAEVHEGQINQPNLDKYNRLKYSDLNRKKELNRHPDWVTSIKPDINNAQLKSGIFEPSELSKKISEYLPFSFAIYAKFSLTAPYYSADDDHYYIIDNPVLKDKVFKVPMFRGSGWKGVVASAVREVMKGKMDCFFDNLMCFARLFGAGSEEFRNIVRDIIEEHRKADNREFQNHLRLFALKSLGMKLNLRDTGLDNKILGKIYDKNLKVQRGRLIFYPTYFDKLGLEMINPHKRRTKAGTNPVYYEVVPKGAVGTFQLLYIPADGILKSQSDLQKEVQDDLDLLSDGLKRIFREQAKDGQIKIGAKTKLGWGKVSADHLDFIKRKEDSLELHDLNFLKEFSEVQNG